MHYQEWALELLCRGNIDAKMQSPGQLSYDLLNPKVKVSDFDISKPCRDKKIAFSDIQTKFPKRTSFHLDEKRALALHFFANHELLAIEMMAYALLYYPDNQVDSIQFKKGLVKTIEDEQKHFKLYLHRMREFKCEFGDYPVNDFFWNQIPHLKTPSQFYALMALTFEAANLDFAAYYRDCFLSVDDKITANIMQVVLNDEITHVAKGQHYLNKWREDLTLWQYYLNNLPPILTPARSKGISFNEDVRKKAGLDDHFIQMVKDYRDDFGITNRRNW